MTTARGMAPLLALALFLAACTPAPEPQGAETAQGGELSVLRSFAVAGVGFSTPESVIHEPEADVYLVANIHGSPGEKDGNGFISRISPEGEVLDLRWVDGSTQGTTLHAPKGMALVADTLFVTDIDCLRGFHRETGEPVRELCLDEVAFLNDLAATGGGDLYFSDTGSSGVPGAVYLLRGTADVPQKVALADGSVLEGEALGGPNGVLIDQRGLYVATFGSGEVFQVTRAGERRQLVGPSPMQLDGLVSPAEGLFLVSDWTASAIFWITPDGGSRILAEGLESPADIGFDATRGRVLVPLFRADEVRILEVG